MSLTTTPRLQCKPAARASSVDDVAGKRPAARLEDEQAQLLRRQPAELEATALVRVGDALRGARQAQPML